VFEWNSLHHGIHLDLILWPLTSGTPRLTFSATVAQQGLSESVQEFEKFGHLVGAGTVLKGPPCVG